MATTEAKYQFFGPSFDPLGVRLDLSGAIEGVIRMEPKPARVVEVVADVSGYLRKRRMRGVDASALAQIIRFLRESHFGRCGAGVHFLVL